MSNFVHLHVHTQYSLLDGACKTGELLDRCASLGQTAVAITDHGVMYGVQEFYKEAKKRGIKPIIGCEVYVAARTRFDKDFKLDNERYHLILLCKNMTGYKNLIKLVSLAFTEGFYTKPRVDRELLEKYSEGLICLSGCLFGEVQQRILLGDTDGAREVALWYRDVFGADNYYLEIQNHGYDDDVTVIDGLMRLSRDTGIPLAATNDVHYVTAADAELQKVLVCIQTNKTITEDTGLDFSSPEFYLKSREEMAELLPHCTEALDNTEKIADACDIEFEYGVTKLPHFDLPDNTDHPAYLRKLCEKGLSSILGGAIPDEYSKRLDFELSVICEMGFCDYFLIVSDFIRFAKENGIPVGPGRGSAAGSLAAYSIGITGIDPIQHKLLFERFLNPERVSMPDIDIDFCYERRDEVIKYCTKKYGETHIAQIVTFNTLLARAAVRDVARVLALPYSVGDTVAKLIPREMSISLSEALKKSEELRNLYDGDESVKRLIDTAEKIEGMPRHASTHAAGVVITEEPVFNYVPLAKNNEDVVTQYTMTELEELGLLKMDFLGLRTLTVIDYAVREIKRSEPDFSLDDIPLDSPEVFSALSNGNTVGVFQCESRGMTNLITSLKPDCFEDIAAALALYRPGPMYFINEYIANRKNPSQIKYKSPLLKDILDETCGCMVYQEQVMQVFRTLAGYSYGRADVVRRAMSKKKHDVMEREREVFINGLTDDNGNIICDGAVRRGTDAKTANEIFSDMTSFASYGFNKSHTVAYGRIAYQTAYLKVKYPREFMAALITSVLDDSPKVAAYVAECERLGIKLLPPSVKKSFADFRVENEDIRFGLAGVKNLGQGLIEKLVENREKNGEYKSFTDFLKRSSSGTFNKRAAENLIKCGALDGLGANRREMLRSLPLILDRLDKEKQNSLEGQLNFFSAQTESKHSSVEQDIQPLDELPEAELLAFEKEVTGLYISGHPVRRFSALAKSLNCTDIIDITGGDDTGAQESFDGKTVSVLGIISSVKKKVTKKDEIMAFAVIEDAFGSMELLVFPRVLEKYASLINVGCILLVKGRISKKDEEDCKLIPDTVEDANSVSTTSPASPASSKRRKGLYIKLPAKNEALEKKLLNIISIFDEGTVPVYFFYADTKSYCFTGEKYLTVPNEPMLRLLKELTDDSSIVLWS